MRTGNPALSDAVFQRHAEYVDDTRMTLMGTVHKCGLLLLIALLPAAWVWGQLYTAGGVQSVGRWIVGGALGGLVIAIVTVAKPAWAPITAPLYAALEGLLLGAVSALFERSYPGIVVQAVTLTFGTLFALLFAYRSGLIQATENFKLGVVAATGAIALVYVASIVLGFFGIAMPFIHDSGPIGILVSLVIVVVAALNLVLDFDFIERGVEGGAPKYMEWYAAFGLLVTLVWLYLEMLRLLAKLNSRR